MFKPDHPARPHTPKRDPRCEICQNCLRRSLPIVSLFRSFVCAEHSQHTWMVPYWLRMDNLGCSCPQIAESTYQILQNCLPRALRSDEGHEGSDRNDHLPHQEAVQLPEVYCPKSFRFWDDIVYELCYESPDDLVDEKMDDMKRIWSKLSTIHRCPIDRVFGPWHL